MGRVGRIYTFNITARGKVEFFSFIGGKTAGRMNFVLEKNKRHTC